MAYESANGFFGSFNSTYGNLTGIRATAANTLKVMQLDGGNAILEVTQDARAPIFYDSNDTGYYLNPASTSILNRVDIDDDLDVRALVGTWITSNRMSDAIGWNYSYGVYIASNVGGTQLFQG